MFREVVTRTLYCANSTNFSLTLPNAAVKKGNNIPQLGKDKPVTRAAFGYHWSMLPSGAACKIFRATKSINPCNLIPETRPKKKKKTAQTKPLSFHVIQCMQMRSKSVVLKKHSFLGHISTDFRSTLIIVY